LCVTKVWCVLIGSSSIAWRLFLGVKNECCVWCAMTPPPERFAGYSQAALAIASRTDVEIEFVVNERSVVLSA
jgi:hypothetical protein